MMVIDVQGSDSDEVRQLVTRSEALRVEVQEAYTQVVNLLADRSSFREILGLDAEERFLRVNALFQLHGYTELACCIRERSRLPRSPLARMLLRLVPGSSLRRFVRWRTDRLAVDGLRLLLEQVEEQLACEAERLGTAHESFWQTIAELRSMVRVVVATDRDPPATVTAAAVVVQGQRIPRAKPRACYATSRL